jgi:uncharacterized protein with HEPN domain
MSRDFKVYLEDIVEAIQRIREYSLDLSLENLLADRKTLDAIVRNLEIIGEATKNIPEYIRSEYPHEDWKKIAGLRDILIHEYFGIDVEIIWDILKNKLGSLEETANRILGNQTL